MSIAKSAWALHYLIECAHLGESAIVPDVSMVREAVAHEAKTALLDVLLYWIEALLLAYLHFGVGPPGDLHDHVQDSIVLVREERNVVERRDDLAVALNVSAVLCTSISNFLGLD